MNSEDKSLSLFLHPVVAFHPTSGFICEINARGVFKPGGNKKVGLFDAIVRNVGRTRMAACLNAFATSCWYKQQHRSPDGGKNDDSQRCAVYENLISQLFLSPAGSSRLNELQERQD